VHDVLHPPPRDGVNAILVVLVLVAPVVAIAVIQWRVTVKLRTTQQRREVDPWQ
jgi:hypothetical protein